MKSPYYSYHDRHGMAGLRIRFEDDSKFHDVWTKVKETYDFPTGYECHEPVFIGSPKPRFYDMWNDLIVSERLAEVLDREAGNKIRLIPIHYTPDPKSKFPATDKYYFLWVPKIDCLDYVYGDPLPVSDYFRKKEMKEGRTPPETVKPILRIDLKMDVVSEYPMFRLKAETVERCLMTEKIMKACKAEKFYGLHFSPYQDNLEHTRMFLNSRKGLDYLFYNLFPLYFIPGPPPAGITREFLTSLLPPK
jgi:hypothetical protein